MASKNLTILIGNVGKDPEITYTSSGTAVAKFSLATSEKWKNKNNPDATVEKTQWHRITAWGKLAEIIGEYVKKGSSLYIEGRIEYGSYEKDGQKFYTTDIVAKEMQMIGGRNANERTPEQANNDTDGSIPF